MRKFQKDMGFHAYHPRFELGNGQIVSITIGLTDVTREHDQQAGWFFDINFYAKKP
jgi:hypothetical protein